MTPGVMWPLRVVQASVSEQPAMQRLRQDHEAAAIERIGDDAAAEREQDDGDDAAQRR